MEAKDTVMKDTKIYTGSTPKPADQVRELLEAQAEISFKAGMREVVEFIRENIYGRVVDKEHIHKLRVEIPLIDWKAFIKKRGL